MGVILYNQHAFIFCSRESSVADFKMFLLLDTPLCQCNTSQPDTNTAKGSNDQYASILTKKVASTEVKNKTK